MCGPVQSSRTANSVCSVSTASAASLVDRRPITSPTLPAPTEPTRYGPSHRYPDPPTLLLLSRCQAVLQVLPQSIRLPTLSEVGLPDSRPCHPAVAPGPRAGSKVPPVTLTIAHRGDPVNHWGNTLHAFQSAARLGADMVELDCRLTSDGQVVVVHDETLAKPWGVRKAVAEMTWDEVSAVGRQGYRIPRLAEALAPLPSH